MYRDSDGIWRAFVAHVGPGQQYGFRACGPYAPADGLRCNPAKLLMDPYAKLMSGMAPGDDPLLGANATDSSKPDGRDSAAVMPKCIVVDKTWDWGMTPRPEPHGVTRSSMNVTSKD